MRNKLTMVALAALATTALACGSGGEDTAGPGAQDDGAAAGDGKKSVVLEVTGAKSADVTYGLGADLSQEQGAKVPWKKSLSSGDALLIATVTAQNKGDGDIACKITIDGKVVKENKSSGQFAVVTCTNS